MRFIAPAFRFMFGLLLASCTALYLMQHEAWFKKSAEKKVKQFFRSTYGATLEGDLEQINLFSPQLDLNNIRVKPIGEGDEWAWSADKARLHFSWLDVMRTGSIEVRVGITTFHAYSEVDKTKLAVGEHLMKLFLPPDLGIPAVFKELQIQRGDLEFFEKNKGIRTALSLRVETKKIGRTVKAGLRIAEGSIVGKDIQWITHGNGTVDLDLADSPEGIQAKVATALDFEAPQLHRESACHLAGSWDHDHASFVLYNNNRSIVLDPITLDQSMNLVARLKAPLSYLQHFLPITPDDQAQGTCTAHVTANMKAPLDTMEAAVTVQGARYKNIDSNMQIEAKASGRRLGGAVTLDNAGDLKLSGSWEWCRETGLDATIKNIKKIRLPNWWVLKKNDLAVHFKMNPAGILDASFWTKLTHAVSQKSIRCDGKIVQKDETILLSGNAGKDSYEVEIATEPLMFRRCVYQNKQGVLARFSSEGGAQKNNFEGTIDYALVYSWLPKELKKELLGSGIFKIKATQDEHGVHGTVSLADASIRIPRLYNFIGSLQADFVWKAEERKLLFQDILCRLHRGGLHSSRVTVFLDDSYSIDFIHAPVLIDSCFVSWQKDLFAIISGNILFKFLKDEPNLLQGTVFVDRSQLKGNIFSHDLQQSMLLMPDTPLQTKTHDLNVDMTVLTREPLRIKTSFVEAQAIFDMSIQKSISSPEVAGKIEILQGELKFPYKPLSIVSGIMYVLPQQMYDPLIELTARNKIKKYGVNLYVTGSVQNPHIHFEASPTLTEEQIIALLLTGAQDSSLNTLMPALIMNNIQQVIFGPAKTPSKLKSYFRNFLKPLSHVRIVPSFTDETGRGGLRAAIEIDVNDQLSAVIEKNFSLSEDVKFEIDYALSDDISLKGVQDERGDFGGEVEVKWKF